MIKLLKFYNYKVYSGGIDISRFILDMVKLNGLF